MITLDMTVIPGGIRLAGEYTLVRGRIWTTDTDEHSYWSARARRR